MIRYDNQSQFFILFQMAGSVIPQSLPIAIFTGSLGLLLAILRYTGKTEELYQESYIKKSFAIQILATVVGYLIVVRTNMALRRYMEGISNVQEMLSKWSDAYTTLIGFFSGKEGPQDMQRRILLFRVRVAHWFSLMSCLAFATLRGGSLGKLTDVPIRELLADNYEGNPLHGFSDKRPSQCFLAEKSSTDLLDHKLEALRGSELVVLHRPSNEEVERLMSSTDAVNVVCLWIIQGVILEIRAQTLDTPPPIVTRVLQELSNGMLGFSQAHKVAMVPFPFPFAQMVSCLLQFFYVVFPFYVDTFTQNIVVTPLICMLVPICYNGLNCLAIELEEPFGCDHNDVDIEVRHEDFNKMLVDTIRQPSKPPCGLGLGKKRPEDKISRGVVRGVPKVHRRVGRIWPWDLVTSEEARQEDAMKVRKDIITPGSEELAPLDVKEGLEVSAKDSSDASMWTEESHFEEGVTENGHSHKKEVLCANSCDPDNFISTMRIFALDLWAGCSVAPHVAHEVVPST